MIENIIKRLLVITLAIGLVGACTTADHSRYAKFVTQASNDHIKARTQVDSINKLQNDLAGLNRHSNPIEADRIAQEAFNYSAYLAQKYALVRPAVLHNVFVRLGFKDRGLCYHWTEDLMRRLKSMQLTAYQLHWGVAYRGSELREHNSVVITAKNQAFEEGIVLDPWRNSGELYWALVKSDRYPWQELPPSEW